MANAKEIIYSYFFISVISEIGVKEKNIFDADCADRADKADG